MLGRGRPAKHPAIGPVRQLSREEVLSVKRAGVAPIQKFRDSHHRMARLFASGLRVKEVAELTGYSYTRVSLYHTNPAFQNLIAEYRDIENEIHRDAITEYNQLILSNGLKAERKLADKLDDDDDTEEMSVRELISIARDAADRVGLSKRTVNTNVNVDFASVLDRAIKRSALPSSGDIRLIESSSAPPDEGPLPPAIVSVATGHPPAVPFLRRRV
jgi:hypothetical protein